MPFAAALSTIPESLPALADACDRAGSDLGGPVDLAVVFFSAQHLPAAHDLLTQLRARLSPRLVLGCVAESVIGNEVELEEQPGLALWLARWSRPVTMTPFHLTLERTADGPSLLGWPDELLEAGKATVLMLGDPYTFPADLFLQRMNEDVPQVTVLGGMASGIREAGDCRLLLGDVVHDQGAAGILLQGDPGLRWIVSQGCRPIGRHMVVTRAQGNVILELAGRTPLDQLRDLWQELSPQEQQLFQRGLHIGRVINEYKDQFNRGDFLIRNVIGLERQSGSLIITDQVRVGQSVQFQVRDAATADEDFQALLQRDSQQHAAPAGALLFSCNGRGSRLFNVPHHDAAAIRRHLGAVPLAGFFAQGELGPVGEQNFIHGFTASVALFDE